jgi:hypothetical protein
MGPERVRVFLGETTEKGSFNNDQMKMNGDGGVSAQRQILASVLGGDLARVIDTDA